MLCDLLIFGTSGHAKVVSDCARSGFPNQIMLGAEDTESVWREIPIYPESSRPLAEWKQICPNAFVAIGKGSLRARVTARLEMAGFQLVTVCHPASVVSPSAVLGAGTLICPGAIVNADAFLGKGCIVNTGAIVEHECRLGEFVHLSPGAVLGGNVILGDFSWVCAGAAVSNNITVGANTTIGAGATVVSDIPSNVLAAGVPAEIKKYYHVNS